MSTRDDRKRAVPRFGSFKPKVLPSQPESQSAPDTPGSGAGDPTVVKETSHSGTPREHASSRRDGSDRRPHRADRTRPPHRSRGGSGPALPDPGSDAFTIDKRGDPLIIRYGGNDRAQVPRYRRYGSGKLLGSRGLVHTFWEGSRERFVIRGYREGPSAFRDKNLLLAAASSTGSRRVKRPVPQPSPPVTEDFIPLGPSRKRKRGEGAGSASSSDEGRHPVRALEAARETQDPSDSGAESDGTSSDSEGEMLHATPARRKSVELSQAVRERPDDASAWLELVQLQDELFREQEDEGHVRTSDEVRGLANLKLSMLEKALSHAPALSSRERLLTIYMREGSRAWSAQALGKRWVEITNENPESFELWKARMDFESTNLATFTCERIRGLFTDRLRYLEDLISDGSDMDRTLSFADQAVYAFLRLTLFLRDSGFIDLAVGAWQGMLELHFARPTLPHGDRATALSPLADFWESEAPRFGEPGAVGWCRSTQEADDGPGPQGAKRRQPSSPLPEAPLRTRGVYEAWAAAERQRALRARMPARITDDDDEGDPFRVVMFADIEPLLAFFPPLVLRKIHPPLIDAFLLFSGSPPAFGSSRIIQCAMNDPFVRDSGQDVVGDLDQHLERDELLNASHGRPPRFNHDAARMAISPDVLFSGPVWFQYLGSWQEEGSGEHKAVDRSFVLHTLRQLFHTSGVEEVGEYCLAAEWLSNPAGVRRAAREMLKRSPSSSRLYNAYASIEWSRGNRDTAKSVLASATTQGLAAISEGQLLWNTRTWIELEAGGKEAALSRLCSSVGGDGPDVAVSPSLLLRARSHFVGRQDYSLSAGALEDALRFAISLALLDYLSSSGGDEPMSASQGDIVAAMDRIQAFSGMLSLRIPSQSDVKERLLQFAARLLYFHASHGPFRPVFIRDKLQGFILSFPQNTLLLTLFAWAESSLHVDDPVRNLLRRVVLAEPHDCVSSRVFAIRHELGHGNAHSVKAAFEGAVASRAGSRDARLWAAYARFCHGREELRPRAKEVFYRALTHCPGSKELYMEAFALLARDMSSAELKSVFSTIQAKGLRVHADLDEFVQSWKKR